MDTSIESEHTGKPLPVWFVALVYIASTGIGCLFGSVYKAPGIVTAGIGGLIAGIVWCNVMNRFYISMQVKWWKLLLIGIGMGVLVGVADAILLNLVGVTLYKVGLIELYDDMGIFDEYLICLLGGSIYGAFGGFVNGSLWSIIATVMYSKKKADCTV